MNAGIVGLGHLGKIHLKLMNEISDFNVCALYDIDKSVVSALTYQNNTRMCDSYDELLNLCEVVLIITPTPTHYELASKAIRAGKHVFIEKPATDSADDTKKLIKLAKEAGVTVQVGHVERFNPAFTAALPLVDAPTFVEIERLACYNSRGTDVSVVLDLMIHDIDLLLCTVKSKIRKVSASGAAIVSKSNDWAKVRIDFENGCVANLTANRIATQNSRKINITQRNTFIEIDLLNKTTSVNRIQTLKTVSGSGVLIDPGHGLQKFEVIKTDPIIHPVNAIKTELEFFRKSITQNLPIAVSLVDAENALAVITEIEQQLSLGKR